MELQGLITEIAELARVPPDVVAPDARLVEDVGLDSLALAELMAILIEEHGADALDEQLLERSWEDVTVSELFKTYLRRTSPPSRDGQPAHSPRGG
jgi:acyl carrier protein